MRRDRGAAHLQRGSSVTWKKLAKAGHTKLVFETDDLLSEVDPSNKQAAQFYDADTVRRYHDNLAMADVITVTTDRLAEHAATINRTAEIHVLPNQGPGWLLDHEKPATPDPRLITIGWRGGKSHDRDFGELAPVAPRLPAAPAQPRPGGAPLHRGGLHAPRSQQHARTRWTGWHISVADFLRAVNFDPAVIPLRDSVFNACKSDLALVEMAALGIPSVMSGVGPYAKAHMAGAPSVLVLNQTGRRPNWGDALRDLVDDAETRTQLGKQAHEWAATRTIEANIHRSEEAYAS